MKKYEVMYILKASLDDAARKAQIEKLHGIFTKNGANVTNVNEWGMRDLAYPIKDETKGYYVVIKVEADNVALKEFERLTKFDANMLRHLVTVDRN
jgi:small subunit ribosomal protein S6